VTHPEQAKQSERAIAATDDEDCDFSCLEATGFITEDFAAGLFDGAVTTIHSFAGDK
jgi:hypothetical protein